MDQRLLYGAGLILLGILIILAAQSLEIIEGFFLGTGALGLGLMLVHLATRKWYCAACGQFLGRGDKPRRCPRCGSNRVTTQDPGVGDAVRIRER